MFRQKISKPSNENLAKKERDDASVPVIDLSSQKKEELVENFFKEKPSFKNSSGDPVSFASRFLAPVKISKTERVALPIAVVLAMILGAVLLFILITGKVVSF